MRHRGIIALPALLTALCLGVALLAILRRHRTELRLTELESTDRAVQATILSARGASPARTHIKQAGEEPQRGSAPKSVTQTSAHPDLNEIFSSHPELQAAYQQAVTGRLHQIYDRFFGRLGLSPEQSERAVAVMMRDDENEMDLTMTANALNLPADDPALRQFRREEVAETQSQLASLLGPSGSQALQDYNRVLGIRTTADDVASLTAVTDFPLTGAQTEQLTQVLADASASYRNGGRPDWTTVDWDDAVGKASAFLTPPQLAALRAKAQQAKAAALLSQFYAAKTKR